MIYDVTLENNIDSIVIVFIDGFASFFSLLCGMHTSSTSLIYLLVIIVIIWSVFDIAKSGDKPNPAYFSPLFFFSFFPLLSHPINSRYFSLNSVKIICGFPNRIPVVGSFVQIKPIYIIAGFLSHPGTCGHRIVAASRLEKQQGRFLLPFSLFVLILLFILRIVVFCRR